MTIEVINYPQWLIDPEDENFDHWVNLRFVDALDEGLEHWYAASVKWDGCIHFWRAYNERFLKFADNKQDNCDYIHICDLDDYIEKLVMLRDAAKKYFKSHDRKWPDL